MPAPNLMRYREQILGKPAREELLECLNAGMTYEQIGERFCVHKNTIGRWIDGLKLTRRKVWTAPESEMGEGR